MKKVLALLLAVAMVVCFTGCGEKKQEESNVIKLGGIGPLTGAYANYGLSVKQGAEIAVAEINAAGGINGKQIDFQMQDSQGDPEAAVSAYGKLIDWGMDVSIGTTLSGEMASVVKESAADDMFMISGSASADACLADSPNAFRICFYDSYQGIAAANYVKKNFPGEKVAVLYESDIDYSKGLYESFEKTCKEIGVEIVEVQSFLETATSYASQITKLVESKAKVIFIPFYAEQAAAFLAQAGNGTSSSAFGDDVFFFGADGLDGILGKVGGNTYTANNVLMLTPFAENSADPAVQSFVKQYSAKYTEAVDQFAADGYDAVYVIKAAVEKAGSTAGSEVTKALLSLTHKGITGTMTWNADGNTNKDAMAIIYKDGVGTVFGE